MSDAPPSYANALAALEAPSTLAILRAPRTPAQLEVLEELEALVTGGGGLAEIRKLLTDSRRNHAIDRSLAVFVLKVKMTNSPVAPSWKKSPPCGLLSKLMAPSPQQTHRPYQMGHPPCCWREKARSPVSHWLRSSGT